MSFGLESPLLRANSQHNRIEDPFQISLLFLPFETRFRWSGRLIKQHSVMIQFEQFKLIYALVILISLATLIELLLQQKKQNLNEKSYLRRDLDIQSHFIQND